MQLSAKFSALAFTIGSVLVVGVVATPASIVRAVARANTVVDVDVVSDAEPTSFVVSHDEMMHWLATTDADITFIGEPINPLLPRAAQETTLTYCTRRIGNLCGGECKSFHGNSQCLEASGTNCLMATTNVGFCPHSGCNGHCKELSSCEVRLDGKFCYTPGTTSILVPST